jgi:hypothetical protein
MEFDVPKSRVNITALESIVPYIHFFICGFSVESGRTICITSSFMSF